MTKHASRKRMRAQAVKAKEKARRQHASANFRSAYEQLLYDKGQAIRTELGGEPDISDFFAPEKSR